MPAVGHHPYPRGVERWERLAAVMTRGAQLGLLALLALASVADLLLGAQLDRVSSGALLSDAVVFLAVLAVSLERRALVPATAVALAGALVLSQIERSGPNDRPALVGVLVGIGALTATCARRAPAWALALLIPTSVVAVIDQADRPTHRDVTAYLVLLALAGIGACIAGGGYLRWLDWQRGQAALEARTEERLDLARELHDLVAHYVTGIVVQAQGAQAVADTRPDVAVDALATIERAGADALAAMRRMVGALRDADDGAMAPPAGLAGLHELVERTSALGVPVRLRAAEGVLDELPPAVAGSVHRIVQESLTNARRHARDATLVDVQVTRVAGAVAIRVHDDGVDADRPARGAGYGLVGMQERATALGGSLRAGPDERGGWSVEALVPLAAARP